MSERQDAKRRGALLKELREAHPESVARAQALLKEQNAMRRKITQVMRDAAKTVPEIATETELPAHEVLWHVTAMKKYGLVQEMGMDGEYYLYQMAEEGKK